MTAIAAATAAPSAPSEAAHDDAVRAGDSSDPDEAGLVVVPDLTGLRVPQARRAARALGLRLVVRSDLGESIPAFVSARYLVRSQRVAAGARVPPGAEVRAMAEDPSPVVGGY
ncbi:MAG: PASTA domain-containing protein [Sandaracinus sp.]